MLTDVEREHLFLLGLADRPRCVIEKRKESRHGCNACSMRCSQPRSHQDRDLGRGRLERAATVMLTDYGSLPPDERNILRFIFLDPKARAAQYDWESVARYVVGAFRWTRLVRERRRRSNRWSLSSAG